MDLDDFYDQINFYVNKEQGGWYAPEVLDLIVDRAQITLFNRYYLEYATSQRLADALAPFKVEFPFTATGGVINMPNEYLDLISLYTLVTYDDSVTRTRPVEMISENEIAGRLYSQVCPVTIYDPVATQGSDYDIQLYPKVTQGGIMYYLQRPRKPHFVYTLVSGRVIVYNDVDSVQLQWNEKDYKSIALIALEELGINLSEQDIIQWGAAKNTQNFTTKMKE